MLGAGMARESGLVYDRFNERESDCGNLAGLFCDCRFERRCLAVEFFCDDGCDFFRE